MSSKIQCRSCKEEADYYCTECELFFCKKCYNETHIPPIDLPYTRNVSTMNTPVIELESLKHLPAAHKTLERLQILLENKKVLIEYSKYDYAIYIWKENNSYCYACIYEDGTNTSHFYPATLEGFKELIVAAFFEDAYIADKRS